MKKSFELNSLLLFALMMVANVCNYLFQIIMGHLFLNIEDYATINTLISLTMYFSIPNTIVLTLSAKYIAQFIALEDQRNLIAILRLLLKLGLIICIIEFLLGFLLNNYICRAFSIKEPGLVIICITISAINLLVSISSGILQGQQRFWEYGTQSIINALVKLAGSIVLVLLGFQIWGVMFAILSGGILAFIYCVTSNLKLLRTMKQKETSFTLNRKLFHYVAGTAFAQSCIIILTYGDMLVVQALFPNQAGIYSSAMVIGKIAMYISTAVVAALFPMVTARNARHQSTLTLFHKALGIGGGSSVAIALGMILFGKYIIQILFGTKYIEALSYLTPVSCFVIAITFLSIVMNYALAIENVDFFSISSLIGISIISIVIALWHTSISEILYMTAIIVFTVSIINYFQCVFFHNKRLSGRRKNK